MMKTSGGHSEHNTGVRSGTGQNKMAVMPVRKLLVSMSIPLMLSLLIQSLYNIVDSIFVARMSEKALTATSLIYAVQVLMIAISVGTAVGLNALLSRRIGQKKNEDACRAATTGMFLTLIPAILFSIFGMFGTRPVVYAMTDNTEIAEMAVQYMQIVVIFCHGTFFEMYGQRLLQSVGETTLSMISLIVGALTNIILDPIMIFGLLGCPAMGIRGAAIATVIGQWLAAFTALLLNRMKNPVIHVTFRNYRFDFRDVLDIYRVGFPTMVMQGVSSVMTFAVNAILMSISPTAVAFFGVYYKLQNFLMMPMNGLGQAAIPIVGFNYGAGSHDRIREVWKTLVPVSAVFAIAATIIFVLFPGQLLSLFSAGDEMLAMGIPALRIISVTFICSTITIICGYFCSGLGNGIINMAGGAIRQLIVLVPFMWLFARVLGIGSVWYAFWIAEVCAFLFSFFSAKKLLRERCGSDE